MTLYYQLRYFIVWVQASVLLPRPPPPPSPAAPVKHSPGDEAAAAAGSKDCRHPGFPAGCRSRPCCLSAAAAAAPPPYRSAPDLRRTERHRQVAVKTAAANVGKDYKDWNIFVFVLSRDCKDVLSYVSTSSGRWVGAAESTGKCCCWLFSLQ